MLRTGLRNRLSPKDVPALRKTQGWEAPHVDLTNWRLARFGPHLRSSRCERRGVWGSRDLASGGPKRRRSQVSPGAQDRSRNIKPGKVGHSTPTNRAVGGQLPPNDNPRTGRPREGTLWTR